MIPSGSFRTLFAGKKPRRWFSLLFLLVFPFTIVAEVSALPIIGPRIPNEYERLYEELEADMDDFEATLDTMMPADGEPVDIFAELLTANTNQGTSMLNPYAIDVVRTNIDQLQELGATGVVFPISFPLLLPEYVSNASDYLTFYTTVAEEVRQRDMKIVVKLHSVFPHALPEFDFEYDELTFATYKDGKTEMAQMIIDNLHPDYLTIINEPVTEASVTGLEELEDPANVAELVRDMLVELNKRATLVGAGSGTWDRPEFISDYLAGIAELDFIDLHVYPVNAMSAGDADYLAQLLTYIDNARSVDPNKKVVVSEAWLYKAADDEIGSRNPAMDKQVFARDIYSFWMPLDQTFLRIMAKAARLKELTFISPFWSRYFFAYAEYSRELADMTASRALRYADDLALENMQNRIYTPTGAYYAQLIEEYGVVQPTPPPPANSTIQVFAEGTAAFGEYPTMVLSIDDVPVRTVTDVSAYQVYSYTHSTNVTPDQVTVTYVNDAKDRETDEDRNLRVDKLIVDGATYETESGNTFSSSNCYTGFKRSEWLNCNGAFYYDQLPASPPEPPRDRTNPDVAILSPADDITVDGGTQVVVDVEAFDLSGLIKVEFTLDGGIRCVDGSSPYTCSITIPDFGTGPYTIHAKAYDSAGNRSAASVTIHTR